MVNKKILKIMDKMSAGGDELWLSRIVPIEKNKKETWIISLINRKKKTQMKDVIRALNSVYKLDKGAEYWVCEKKAKNKWLCTFHPKAAKTPRRF